MVCCGQWLAEMCLMKASTINVSVKIRKFCLWPMALLSMLHLPVPKWMIKVEIVK